MKLSFPSSRFWQGSFALLAISLFSTAASATIVNWGDVSDAGGTVVFEQVTEDNDEPQTLFAPQLTGPTASGDTLQLDPQSFQSQSSGGGADLIDSTLRTTIASKAGEAINSIIINEFGDYSLGGLTGGQATASVGAAFFWRVIEVSNQPMSLPLQMAQLAVSGGGSYDRPGDDGTANPWTGSVLLNIAQYLVDEAIPGVATRIELTFDNTLQTAADGVSNAFIKKKGVEIIVDTGVPEPAAVAMLVAGLASMGMMRWRLG